MRCVGTGVGSQGGPAVGVCSMLEFVWCLAHSTLVASGVICGVALWAGDSMGSTTSVVSVGSGGLFGSLSYSILSL